METLSRELFDLVLERLAVYDFPFSARVAVLDDASRQAMLMARQMARCFSNSKAVKNLFVTVLEETLFRWYGDQMSRLVEISRSSWAAQLSTLSLRGMKFDASDYGKKTVLESGQSLTMPARTDLARVLRRFARLSIFGTTPYRRTFSARSSGPTNLCGTLIQCRNGDIHLTMKMSLLG